MEKDSEQEKREVKTAVISDVTERVVGIPLEEEEERGPAIARVSVFGFLRNIFTRSSRARGGSPLFLAHFFHILVLFLVLPALSTQIRRSAFAGVAAMHTTTIRETRRESYPMTENPQCGRFDRRRKYIHAYRPWITSVFKMMSF